MSYHYAMFEINQNDYATQVWLDISDNQLAVVASSNIDIKRKVGLKFDDNKLLVFTQYIFPIPLPSTGTYPNYCLQAINWTFFWVEMNSRELNSVDSPYRPEGCF